MAAEYPSVIPTFSDNGTKLGSTPTHSTLHTKLNEEVEAIATELGTNPKGASASVKARLDTIASAVTTAQGNITTLQSASHAAVTVSDTATVDMTLSTQALSADVRKQMSIDSDTNGLKLSGDSATPGNNKVYGTDGSGNKGWQSAASPVTTATFTNANLTAGVYAITGSKSILELRNGSAVVILPDDIKREGGNTNIYLTSYGTITGTYEVDYL